MRNFLSLLLGLMLCVLFFAACGSSADESGSSGASPSPSASASPSPSPEPTAEPTASPTAKPTASPEPTKAPTPEPTKAPTPEPTPEPEPVQEPEPEPDYEPEPEPAAASPYDYVGSDINTFYSVFGYPNGSDYGPSCLGGGKDGLLYYDGFVVVTYQDPSGYETVISVG